MVKIAFLSDVHGNLEALKAVLKDIKEREITHIICLGDIIAKGSHPKECLELIKSQSEIVLLGNCEEYFLQDRDLTKVSEVEQKRIKWNQSKLSKEDKYYLSNLPFSYEFYMSGSLVRAFHASPYATNEYISNLDLIKNKKRLFDGTNKTQTKNYADIVFYGHVHTQYIERIYNRTIVNVGSIGNELDIVRDPNIDGDTKGTTQACYAILEGTYGKEYAPLSISLIKVPYDQEKELIDIKNNLEPDNYLEEIKNACPKDKESLYYSLKKREIDPKQF